MWGGKNLPRALVLSARLARKMRASFVVDGLFPSATFIVVYELMEFISSNCLCCFCFRRWIMTTIWRFVWVVSASLKFRLVLPPREQIDPVCPSTTIARSVTKITTRGWFPLEASFPPFGRSAVGVIFGGIHTKTKPTKNGNKLTCPAWEGRPMGCPCFLCAHT